jgi:hypothetical protein
VQSAKKFHRALVALHGYNQARAAGEKHSVALTAAIAEVQKQFPGLRISETEVKRILATYQPKGATVAWTVSKGSDGEVDPPAGMVEALGLREGKKLRHVLSVGFGPRPEYPRFNARPRKLIHSQPEKGQPL